DTGPAEACEAQGAQRGSLETHALVGDRDGMLAEQGTAGPLPVLRSASQLHRPQIIPLRADKTLASCTHATQSEGAIEMGTHGPSGTQVSAAAANLTPLSRTATTL